MRELQTEIASQSFADTDRHSSWALLACARREGHGKDTYALGGDDLAAAGIVLLGLMLPDRSCVGAGAITVAKEDGGAVRCVDGEGSDGLEEDEGRSAPNDGRS